MSNQEILRLLGDAALYHPSTQRQNVNPAEVLTNKVILFYFSAHWCGPCRRFTPLLQDLYHKLKQQAKDGTTDDFEIVFMSMDSSSIEYQTYTSSMPWYCIPHKHSCMSVLSSRYEARGIPHLVIVDSDGSLLTMDGVGQVTTREPQDFPWRPQPVHELLPSHYLDASSRTHQPISQLQHKYLLLYFSAHWCPPCQRFTPTLSKAYKTLKQHYPDQFELLFVSSDHDVESFQEYWKTMPFPAIPYEDRSAKAALSQRLQVRGLPTLVMMGQDHSTVINDNVRSMLESPYSDYVSDFPFYPKSYGDLNQSGDAINNYRCVVVFHELGDDAEQEDIQEALQLACEQSRQKDESNNLRFYWATSRSGLVNVLRDSLKLTCPTEQPVLALVDVPDGGSYYVSSTIEEITTASILEFIANPGEKKRL